MDRQNGAALVTQHMYRVSPRRLEASRLPTRRVNGRAVIPTVTLFEVAFKKLNEAPLVVGGRPEARNADRLMSNPRIPGAEITDTGMSCLAAAAILRSPVGSLSIKHRYRLIKLPMPRFQRVHHIHGERRAHSIADRVMGGDE
jgi:hypothetical protein